MTSTRAHCYVKLAAALKPRDRLTVSTWADRHRFLSSKQSGERGRWRTERNPILREIQDCLSVFSPTREVVIMKSSQVGLALDVDTPIATPTGWSTMGEIVPGDYVFSESGLPVQVTGVSQIYNDHSCYEVVFSDGQSIVADADHLWAVDDDFPGHLGKTRGNPRQKFIKRTSEIAATFSADGRNRYAIPVAGTLSLPDVDLPIDPYTLGIWIADGNNSSNQITSFDADSEEIAASIRFCGYSVKVRRPEWVKGRCVNLLVGEKKRRSDGVCHRGHALSVTGTYKSGSGVLVCAECGRQRAMKHKYGKPVDPVIEEEQGFYAALRISGLLKNKHIPPQYLRASAAQRLALIQGMMDGDGHIDAKGRCEYSSSDISIVASMMELLWSVGLKPKIYAKPPIETDHCIKQKLTNYRISFIAYRDTPVYRVARKRERQPDTAGRRATETRRRRIVDVRHVDSRPVRCIEVDSPTHLYLAGKAMIPTHNTEATVNWLGYIVDHAPSPTMVLMPTLESRDSWKAQKLNPLLTETSTIRNILGGLKSRDAANSKEVIDFPGGILFLAGGNSPNSYAQKSVRNMIMDDLDRFPSEIGDEGDPVSLARGRTKAFARSKLLLISTPTLKGASLIEREYEASDQRHYHVACPACSEFQILRWSNLKWDITAANSWYACEHCGTMIEEHHKPRMLSGGRWIAENPDNKRRGYHISALYAPIGLGPSWLDLAQEFIVAHKDNATLKTFINTHLGEAWEDQTNRLKAHELARRMEAIELRAIPPGCLAITCGIDTQDEWLAVTLLGWGDEHLWVLDWHEIQGDTTRPEVWDRLQDYLQTQYTNAYGNPMRIRAAGIDSRGHRSEQVRQFVIRQSLTLPVYAVQGATTRMGRAIAQSASYPEKSRRGKVIRGGYGLWNIGTEYCKDYLYGHLASDSEKPETERQIRFPQGLDDAYFNGLLSETYDPEKKRYVQRTGAKHKRNEPLDTLVYAWAIGQHKEVNIGRGRNGRPDLKYWERLGAVLEGEVVRVAESAAPETPAIAATPTSPDKKQQPKPIAAKSDWSSRL